MLNRMHEFAFAHSYAGFMDHGKVAGFRVLRFNAVVATNAGARHLYENWASPTGDHTGRASRA